MNNFNYYPICLNLDKKRCLVVGGGEIAARKLDALLKAGAVVTLVAPEITEQISLCIDKDHVIWVQSVYDKSFIEGMVLVIAATDDQSVNESVFRDCGEKDILVNVVDDPSRCSFIIPAVLQRDDLQVTVSTGGAAPMIAGQVRDAVSGMLGDEWGTIIEILKELRPRIKQIKPEQKKCFWNSIRSLPLSEYRNRKTELLETVEMLLKRAEKNQQGCERN